MELKPCPFCGSTAHIGELKKSVSLRFYVYCGNARENCIAAEKYLFGRFYFTRREAIEAWNRRAENEELRFTRQFIVDRGLLYELLDAWEARSDNA